MGAIDDIWKINPEDKPIAVLYVHTTFELTKHELAPTDRTEYTVAEGWVIHVDRYHMQDYWRDVRGTRFRIHDMHMRDNCWLYKFVDPTTRLSFNE